MNVVLGLFYASDSASGKGLIFNICFMLQKKVLFLCFDCMNVFLMIVSVWMETEEKKIWLYMPTSLFTVPHLN